MMQSNEHIPHHGHVGQKLDTLKRPGDPEAGDLVRRLAQNALSLPTDIARLWTVEAIDAVEQTTLASPIRSHDSGNPAFADGQAHTI
jgi:hypothetical protein